MRRLLLCLLISTALSSAACDFCGGGGPGLDVGILAGSQGNQLGFSTAANSYRQADEPNTWLMNWTIRGAYSPVQNLQLKAFLPVYMQISPGVPLKRTGLGDMVLLGEYRAVDKTHQEKNVRHSFSISGGLELPTGLYESDAEQNGDVIPFGSRSWDILAGANYILRADAWIISSGGLVKFNTSNRNDHRYGMSLETALQAGYDIPVRSSGIQPFLGWKYNWQDLDVKNGFYRTLTGGWVFGQLAGLRYSIGNVSLSGYTEIALVQQLNNPDISNGPSVSVQFVYTFK